LRQFDFSTTFDYFSDKNLRRIFWIELFCIPKIYGYDFMIKDDKKTILYKKSTLSEFSLNDKYLTNKTEEDNKSGWSWPKNISQYTKINL
jgi:hypothetical protein